MAKIESQDLDIIEKKIFFINFINFIKSKILTLCSEWLTAPSSSGRIIIAHTSVLSTERKFHHLGFRCLWQVMYQRHSSSLLYTMGCKLFLNKYFFLKKKYLLKISLQFSYPIPSNVLTHYVRLLD